MLGINIFKWPYVIARCCITCPGYSTILNVSATSSSGLVWSIWRPWKETGGILLHRSAFAVTTRILFKIQLDSSQLDELENWCLEGQRGARCHKSQEGIHGNLERENHPNERPPTGTVTLKYRKIPKISPGAYIFQRSFLRGLFLEGLIFGGAYLRRKICVSKSIGLAL